MGLGKAVRGDGGGAEEGGCWGLAGRAYFFCFGLGWGFWGMRNMAVGVRVRVRVFGCMGWMLREKKRGGVVIGGRAKGLVSGQWR